MLASWRQWCRLCAEENSTIGIFSKNEDNSDIPELIRQSLQLNVNPFDEAPVTICTACYQFLLSVASFAERASKVESMYSSIIYEKINTIDWSSIKYQFGLAKDELSMYASSSNQSTDTLDMTAKCSSDDHVKIESLLVQVDEKRVTQKMYVSYLDDGASDKDFSDDEDDLYKPVDDEEDLITSSDSDEIEIIESPNTEPKHKRRSNLTAKKKEFPCSKCNKKFPTRRRAEQHEIVHLDPDQKPAFPCPDCDKHFTTTTNLKTHIRKIHLGERPFMCEACGKSFATNAALKEHNYTHMEVTPFKCSKCDKQFNTPAGLKNHEDIHSETTYVCPKCGLILNTKRTLQRHMVVHSEQKKHKCTFCSSEFKRAKALKNHLILHTGLRPYTCPFCDKTFANGSNCRSHKKKAHPIELAAMEAAGVPSHTTNLPQLKQLRG